jgi:hypothetical protein
MFLSRALRIGPTAIRGYAKIYDGLAGRQRPYFRIAGEISYNKCFIEIHKSGSLRL